MSDMVSYVVAEKISSGGGDCDSDNIYSYQKQTRSKICKMAPSMEKFWN